MPRYEDDYDGRPASRRRYYDDEHEYDFEKRELPHSGVGIASCVLALLAVLAGAFGMALAASVGFDDFGDAVDAEEPEALLALAVLLGSGLLMLIGLVLAFAGLLQRDRNRLFALLGLCANGLMALCGFGLMLLAMLTD